MNVLREGERAPRRGEVEPLVQLVSSFAPHIAEELWERLGHTKSVFDAGWPAYDPTLAAPTAIDLVVQVNGKMRATIQVPLDITQDAAVAIAVATASVSKYIPETGVKKVIFVPGRLVNLVV
jgi:leucyl-tRNA synthetase